MEDTATSGRALTIAQIEEMFEGEWILIGDPQTDRSHEVKGGRVLFHSKDRDEVYRKAVELRPRRFATHYTGRLPRDSAIVL
jgi:hypothetical protein